jgi:hypothetical protein
MGMDMYHYMKQLRKFQGLDRTCVECGFIDGIEKAKKPEDKNYYRCDKCKENYGKEINT